MLRMCLRQGRVGVGGRAGGDGWVREAGGVLRGTRGCRERGGGRLGQGALRARLLEVRVAWAGAPELQHNG